MLHAHKNTFIEFLCTNGLGYPNGLGYQKTNGQRGSKYQKTIGEQRITQRHNSNINSYVNFTLVYPVQVQRATKSEREVNRNTPTAHPVRFPIQNYKVSC
jgi:hypothetical protein